ncbi:flagellar basal body rod protein FlgB [Anaeromyxobacter paludicola]|uniref:Flagellar basal body rod protein FlgB n=1 Tax=Anaeromyxobacter paludicola TaxID=2918171 RepID=A0ABM7X7Y9_9BACT|nr:flagellar basal body rod protein FlgB [Anaeromyxobacter paludicola]BDG07965.1 flagellar basal body rod protein FlgB [Anaeromyxobacter paludicola]
MKLFDATLMTLERALDARLVRQNVLASNLANADTPGFAPKDVDFAKMMEGALAQPAGATREGDLPLTASSLGGPAPLVAAPDQAGAGLDGNSVDVDRTLAAVAENAIQYGAAAKAAQKKLAILRYAASDGAA